MDNRSTIYKSSVDLNSLNNPKVMAINYMKNSPVVLDVGCACGDLGVALKEHRNATIFGLEYNQGSIDIALETGAYEEIYQFNLDEITENSFPQYKGKFDYVVCGDVLEHLRDPMRSLNILKSYLKEDGKLIASIPNVAHMSIKSNLLVNDFTYTPLGLLDETHIHLFTHKSIATGLASIGLQIDNCKFTLQRKVAWQPNNPYPQLSDDMKDYLFKDWHSYVCQYVMSISPSEQNSEELFNHNIKKLNIDENNAPENIKNYRTQILAELTNTTGQKLSAVEKNLNIISDNQQQLKNQISTLPQNHNDIIENSKAHFNELKSQNVVAENKLITISETQQNIQIKLKFLEGTLSSIKTKTSQETLSIKQQLANLEHKIAREKEFALHEEALRDKIQDLKERRKFYKNLTVLFFLLFVGLLSYVLFF